MAMTRTLLFIAACLVIAGCVYVGRNASYQRSDTTVLDGSNRLTRIETDIVP